MSTPSGRFDNREWVFPSTHDGWITNYDYVTPALLQDIREELRKLNRVLACPNFQGIPAMLRKIEKNTRKKKNKTRPQAGAGVPKQGKEKP